MLRRVAEEALRFQKQQLSDEGSSLTSLQEAEARLRTLAGGNGDSEAFSALESESDSEQSVQSNYKSSHDTPDDPEDEESNSSSTPPTEKAENRAPTPPAERVENRAQELDHTSPVQPSEDYTMPYPYPKYRDDPDAEAHVYAFLQTWEANHVSQRLTEPEAERSKIAEFGMTLEGLAARWHAKHLPGSFATFEALKTKFLRLFHRQVEQRELVGQFYTTHQEEQEIVPQFIIRF